jgi:YggT family protein
MSAVFTALAAAVNLYSLIIFARIILTWFSGAGSGRLAAFLGAVTDPYLNWFRRFPFLRAGYLDLSPVAGITLLSLLSRTFSALAFYGRISAGVILAMALSAAWSAASFLLGFCAILLALRLAAFLFGVNSYAPFWRVVDTLTAPLLFRVNRFLFRGRLVPFLTGLLSSLALFAAAWAAGRLFIPRACGFLARLPF